MTALKIFLKDLEKKANEPHPVVYYDIKATSLAKYHEEFVTNDVTIWSQVNEPEIEG